jgi:hypothetical protein
LAALGRPEEALHCFDKALETGRTVDALYNRGIALLRLDRFPESLATLDDMLRIDPDFSAAWNNRGSGLRHLGREGEALPDFGKALALSPDYLEAKHNLAICLCKAGDTEEGLALFTQLAQSASQCRPAEEPSPVKARHERGQREYRSRNNKEGAAGDAVPGPAVNRDLSGIAARWQNAQPLIVVIDDFLTANALDALRTFCLDAAIWETAFPEGYLGAFPEQGFSCPLLAQISREFAAHYPAIIGTHALRYLWAFKYDSACSGIKVHADFARVNVNFWITPDEANLDPESGGLVIWDLAAPADWKFDKYNGEAGPIRELLSRHGARAVKVRYRANRAVIFDSDLFNETDRIHFKDGYVNRRINITKLYGKRPRPRT